MANPNATLLNYLQSALGPYHTLRDRQLLDRFTARQLKAMALTKATEVATFVTVLALLETGVSISAYRQLVPGGAGVPPERPAVAARPNDEQAKKETPPAEAIPLSNPASALGDGVIARLGTLKWRGLAGPIQFTPDGKHLVAATGPHRSLAAFFEPTTGRRVFELDGGASNYQRRLSPDGKRMVCTVFGSYHNPAWDLESRKQLFTFEGSEAGYSKDGTRLITVSFYGEGHCRVLDGTSGKVLEDCPLEAQVGWAAVLPDGEVIVFYDKKTGQAVVYDWTKKTRISAFACTEGFGPTAHPDGKTLALADRESVRLIDVATGKEVKQWKQRSDGRAVFSADGKRVAWSGYDETIGIAYPWLADVAGTDPRRLGQSTNDFTPPCFTPDGKALVVLMGGGALEWRDLETGKQLHASDAHSSTVLSVLPLPDGQHLLSRDQNRLLVWHWPTGKLVRCYPDELPQGETAVLYPTTESGCMLTKDAATGTVRLRDLVSGRAILTLEGNHGLVEGPFSPPAISADNTTAAMMTNDYQIRVFDLTTGKVRHTHKADGAVWFMDLSEDGRYFQWSIQRRVDEVRDAGPFTLDTHTGKIETMALGTRPTGQWSYLGQEEALKLLSAKKLVDLEGQPIDGSWQKSVFRLFPSPDGRLLAIDYSIVPPGKMGPNKLGLWDLETKKPLAHVKLEPGTLRFSPDSRLVLTTTLEGIIDVCEIATGQKRLQLKAHLPGEVPALAYLPDGRTLASGGADSQVLLWDLTGRAPDGVWRTVRHTPEKLRAFWDALGAPDAAAAHRAIWELAADPEGATRFLAEKLWPAPNAEAKVVARLIEDLNSDRFATRQRATGELAQLGEAALPALRKAFKKPATLEQAQRLQLLLVDVERLDLTGERLRGVRAVEVLESIRNPGARAVLESLAAGQSAARLTREARAALGRMK
jgi:WD40 repeat protein